MSGELENDVLLLPTTDDLARLGKVFEDVRPTKVYILYNKDPQGLDDKLNSKIREDVRALVDENTIAHDEVVETGIDFYEFEAALLDIYRIIIREDRRGNDVYANLVGGTRPVALALTYACSLAGVGEPIYYASEKAEQAGDGVETTGVIDEQFELLSIPAFNIRNLLPEHDTKTAILTGLNEMADAARVSEILIHLGEIQPRGPSGVDDKTARSNKIKRYSNHAQTLTEDGLLTRNSKEYELTNIGEIAASLIDIRRNTDEYS